MAEAAGRRTRRVTMTDVARVAGISRGTVSRYVTGGSYVSAASREAIADAIERVGYVPNAAARALAGTPNRNVVLIVHEQANMFADDPNLVGMMTGAKRTLADRDHQLHIMLVGDDRDVRRMSATLANGSIDGAMLASARVGDPLVDLLHTADVPAAIVGRSTSSGKTPLIDVDNRSGAQEITARLVATGRRRLAMIAGPSDMRAALDRVDGFRAAAGARADPELIVPTQDWSFEAGKKAMTELLALDPTIDGVFGACDAIAAGAIEVLQAAHVSIPGQVGVVGFDDTHWATHVRPNLSTVAQPAEALGARMAEFVIRQLDGEDLSGVVALEPTEVVWRASA